MPFKTDSGRQAVLELYWRHCRRLNAEPASLTVETVQGPSHVLALGPADAEPLVIFHGIHSTGPFQLASFLPLARSRRLILADVPGQPGPSEAERPGRRHHGYGRWAASLLDGLGLATADVAGISFGGAVAMDLAALAPARPRRLILIVPVGLPVLPRLGRVLRLGLGFAVWRVKPSQRLMRWAMKPLMREDYPPLTEWNDAVARHFRPMAQLPPGPFGARHFRDLEAPVLAFLAEDDVFTPLARAQRALKRLFPYLRLVVRLRDRHIWGVTSARVMNERIGEFLAEPGA